LGAMSGAPRVAVVIVTYNSAAVLSDCLRSLTTVDGVRLTDVVVADNDSRDDTLSIAGGYDQLPLRTVQLGHNAGYAAAVNAAIAALTSPFDAVFVMNPDCRLRPDSLRLLADALGEPGRGITVPRILNPDGTLQCSLRRMPTVRGAFAEALLGGPRAGRAGAPGELITDTERYGRAGAATWATGAAMLIGANAARAVGPWDESFFLYSEETEFALRAADLGFTLWFEPAAVVEHIGGESSTNPALAALLVANKVRLFRRRNGAMASAAYYLAVVLGQAGRALAGRPTAKAAVAALLRPSRNPESLALAAGKSLPRDPAVERNGPWLAKR
jgi:N-acetylglucosaminyl-diphospho-decaprenol L-rhamnosyltransferase